MKIIGVIPARYASTRFPGKPLIMINGMSMIQRVYMQAVKASMPGKIIVATDDERIYNHVKEFNGNVIMTSPLHHSGTDRCAEAVSAEREMYDAVINIQGDEPFINPHQIDLVAGLITSGASVATLVRKIEKRNELFDENIPKVVIDSKGKALYFSRQAIPFIKSVPQNEWLDHAVFYKHIGIYGFRTAILKQLATLKTGILEKLESLEQLRWMEQGYSIETAITTDETVSIDTPEDLDKISSQL